MTTIPDPVPDFPTLEKKIFSYWDKHHILQKYLDKNKTSAKRFSFIDGPITANNPMGVHHAWGRTYKDLFARFNTMRGYRQRYQNGFDAQGLWVEVEVEKTLGFKNKKEIETYGVDKFVQKCKDRVVEYSKIQTEQSKRLGYFMDWEHSYYTNSDDNNYMIWHFLKVCHENGWLYKGKESVPWCPRCETAISQHEMLTEDYKEVVHEAIYFELPIVGRNKEYLLVWTTTPWTLPANIAVAVDEKLDYSLVEGNSGDLFWIAKEAVERVFKKEYKRIVKTVKGSVLVGLSYTTVFDDLPAVSKTAKEHKKLFHSVIATDPLIMPINTQEGTGLVHTAVSAGTEDYKLGKKLGLPMIAVIADNGTYLEHLGFLSGQNAKKHPELVLNYMKERDSKEEENWVFEIENYKHRYPACWRCKTELMWKVTDEWYIAMDKKFKGRTLRERMIAVAKQIQWIPSFGLERELDWLSHMQDWLISKKNRYWGLALPIWECKTCNVFEVIGSKEELHKKAVSGWDQFKGKSPHKPFIDHVYIACPKCGKPSKRIEPVGNPWLDAGIVAYSTIAEPNGSKPLYTLDKKKWKQWVPADLITESFPGQFKNWFYSLIAMSTVLEDIPPSKTILGFATLFAEDGRPMHKSWGNMIEFNKGADLIGVDVMRWMYARQNPQNNMLFGYQKATLTRRAFHILLWNVYRYFITQKELLNWKPVPKTVKKTVLDTWILGRLDSVTSLVGTYLESYDVFYASNELEIFVNELSTWYVRRIREREDKDVVLTVLHQTLLILSRLLAPFIPFVTEEMYTAITADESVHLTSWPALSKNFKPNTLLFTQMNEIRKVCELGHAKRKEVNIKVRQPLSSIEIKGYSNSILKSRYKNEFEQLLCQELNIKNVVWSRKSSQELTVQLNTVITPALKEEGEARDIIRTIQVLRKEMKLSPKDKVKVTLVQWPALFEDTILKKANATALQKGDTISIEITN